MDSIFNNQNLENVNIFQLDEPLLNEKNNLFGQLKEEDDEDFDNFYDSHDQKASKKTALLLPPGTPEKGIFLKQEGAELVMEEESLSQTPRIEKDLQYHIDLQKGPEQFLKTIGKNRDGSLIFKMSDLFYPYYEQEYVNLEKYIKRRVKSAENTLDPHKRDEHFQTLHKAQQELAQYYSNLNIIMHNLNNEEVLQGIQTLYGDINSVEMLDQPCLAPEKQEDAPLDIHQIYSQVYQRKAQQADPCYDTLNSYEFYQDLKKQMLSLNARGVGDVQPHEMEHPASPVQPALQLPGV